MTGSQSSRDARSARREALRKTLKERSIGKGRVTKQAVKPKESKVYRPSPEPVQVKPEMEPEVKPEVKPEVSAPEQPQVEEPVTNTEATESRESDLLQELEQSSVEASVDLLDESFVDASAELPQDVAPKVSTPPPADTISYEPMTPTSPLSSDPLYATKPVSTDVNENVTSDHTITCLTEPTMTDDDLQTYLREFEAVSNGADVPETENHDVSSIPLSPVLEASNSPVMETRPTSPLNMEFLGSDNLSKEDSPAQTSSASSLPLHSSSLNSGDEDLKIDEYLNYMNDSTTEFDPVPATTQVNSRRRVPFCAYQHRWDMNPVSSTFNPNKRTLIAAFHTMAPDVEYRTREAYFHSVLLAAASLNQRSLLSGRARETMAPALETSY